MKSWKSNVQEGKVGRESKEKEEKPTNKKLPSIMERKGEKLTLPES